MTWQIDRAMLVQDVTSKINRVSKLVQGAGDPLLDDLATLQAYKRNLERADDPETFSTLAEQWQETAQDKSNPITYQVVER